MRRIDIAADLPTLGGLTRIGLDKTSGDLRDLWSADVNADWRILFRCHDGSAFGVHNRKPH